MSNIQNKNQEDLLGKKFDNLSGQNHDSLPKDLQTLQDEKKQHTWEQNENKHLVHGKDYNIADMDRKVPINEQIKAHAKQEGELNWNESRNQPYNLNQNNTQSIQADQNSLLQNQSRDVPLNNSVGVPISHKNPEDNKNKTREEADMKHEFHAPAPVTGLQCGDSKVSHGLSVGSQKQNLSGADKHRAEESKNVEGLEFATAGQKELVTKASKKDMNHSKDVQGPSWVAGEGHDQKVEAHGKDYTSQTAGDANLKTGLEKAETDVIKETRANQDTAHGK